MSQSKPSSALVKSKQEDLAEPFRYLIGIQQNAHLSIYLRGVFHTRCLNQYQNCIAQALQTGAQTTLFGLQSFAVSQDAFHAFGSGLQLLLQNTRTVIVAHASDEIRERCVALGVLQPTSFFSTMDEALNRLSFQNITWK